VGDLWEIILRERNQVYAKTLVDRISAIRKEKGECFDSFAKVIDYPSTNIWKKGELNPHFRRVLVELKTLSITGVTVFKV